MVIDGRKGVDMRIGSVNVGTMRGRSAEMAARSRLDICCVCKRRVGKVAVLGILGGMMGYTSSYGSDVKEWQVWVY